MNTYPGIIISRRTRTNLRHFQLLPINPPTESAVQFRAARALNQLSSHASLLVGKWRHCRNSTNYQHHIWRPEKISNSVTLFAVRPIVHFTLFSAKSKIYMKHHSNWHWIDTATIIFMIPQNLRKGEQYYRNFRPLTRTADYPHRSIFAIARKKFQQITRTGR